MTVMLPHVLVVDDDARLRRLLRRYLVDNGFWVSDAEDVASARERLASLEFDLLVLDVMMPGGSGLDFLRDLRLDGQHDLPILLLTARDEPQDRIGGFEAGADDYLAKPFEPKELVLRINAILRRAAPAPAEPEVVRRLRLGRLVYDPAREALMDGDHPIRLTTAELALLKALAAAPGRVLSRNELTRQANVRGDARAVDVQVTRLRRKIEPDPKAPRYLHTVRGEGYVLRPDPD